MSETITCPSGLSGRIRGMKAREERILADRKLARLGGGLRRIQSRPDPRSTALGRGHADGGRGGGILIHRRRRGLSSDTNS